MDHTGLSVKLQLAYPPVSNYDFTHIRTEEAVQHWLKESMLYMIVQRPVLTFERVQPGEAMLTFDIHQQGTEEILHCRLPLQQHIFIRNPEAELRLEIGWHDAEKATESLPAYHVDAFKFYENEEFMYWLTPERFIYEYLHDNIDAEVKGNTRAFVSYYVHYVGKATDQPIWNRLDGHKTLQKILSIVKPLAQSLPTHELALLLFQVGDAQSIKIFEPESLFESGPSLPSKKEISLDAEKMLVRVFQPDFNDPKKRFPSYPISKDGLYGYNFNRYGYQIIEDLSLNNGQLIIEGSLDQNRADLLTVHDNQEINIYALASDW
ncbi:hypothetical protein [Mucilaginibacter sp. OK098]|uniref:hypothetical protein n=1 Tax=Mucilaginibacter sp. OK098 TaxID=1855297 RepID=UPI00091E4396|nr:hypothetical protein [Mucilaginibacter sp. OK098]SHM93507.1 hypothetical protein SAMN05216524_104175 [Mucilaginibacter sp. OK098]